MPIDSSLVKWDDPIPENQVKWDSTPNAGVIDKIRTATESVLEPMATIATGAIAQPLGNLIGMGKEVLTGDFGHGTAERTAQDVQTALTYRPRNPVAQDMLTKLSEMFDKSKLAGLPVAGNELPMVANAIKQQMPYLKTIPQQVADSPEMAAIGKMGQAVSPDISPATKNLALKLEDMGGRVPLHTLTNNKYVRMAGEALDNLPLAGSTKPANKVAFNQALIKQIGGGEGELLTPASFAPAMEKSGQAIGQMYAKTNIPLDETLTSDLMKLFDAQKLQVRDVRSVVGNYIKDIFGMGQEGSIPGQALRTQDTALGTRIRSLPPGDLRNQLSDLQEILRDSLARQLSPEDVADLNVFRKQYAIGKVLEPLVAKSGENGVTPQSLLGRVTATTAGKHRMAMGAAGDIGDLANIGQRFMKEVPSSGTAERGMILGAALDTGKALGGLTVGNLYNRIGPRIASRLIRKSAEKPATSQILTLGEGPIPQNSPLPYPPVRENPLLSLMENPPETIAPYQVEGLDFPLRQEVLNTPEITAATNAFRQEASRLQDILDNKYIIDRRVKANAAQQLNVLQNEFAAGMRQLGIENAGDANGLRRMLYETGRNQLPIERTYSR